MRKNVCTRESSHPPKFLQAGIKTPISPVFLSIFLSADPISVCATTEPRALVTHAAFLTLSNCQQETETPTATRTRPNRSRENVPLPTQRPLLHLRLLSTTPALFRSPTPPLYKRQPEPHHPGMSEHVLRPWRRRAILSDMLQQIASSAFSTILHSFGSSSSSPSSRPWLRSSRCRPSAVFS